MLFQTWVPLSQSPLFLSMGPSAPSEGDAERGGFAGAELDLALLRLVDPHVAVVGVHVHVEALERAGRRPLEVDAVHVVARAVARALELVLGREPVGRAAEVRADRRD